MTNSQIPVAFRFTVQFLRSARVLRNLALAAALSTTAIAVTAQTPSASSPPTSSKTDAMVTELKKIDVKQGAGAEAVSGKPVLVHYTGWLYDPSKPDQKGAKFDSSHDRKVPFGFIIGAVSSYLGYTTTGGSEGIGRASTRSVVLSSMGLIIVNVLLVRMIFLIFPGGAM